MAYRNNDTTWFEAKLAKEPQRSYTHEDFEERKEMKEEKHGDVEILMAVSKSIVGSERPDLDSTEQFYVESLAWAGNGMMQDMSYWPKTIQRMEGSMKTSVMMVNETMEQHSRIYESALRDRKLHEVFLPPFVLEEKNKKDVNSFENKKEGLDFRLIDVSSNEELSAGSDELVEQGLVRKLDLTQDSDDYQFSEGV